MRSTDDLLHLIQSRRSIRRYRSEPVARETIDRLLEAAAWAPSAHNRQPWRFAVVTSQDAKERLAKAMSDRLRADRTLDGDSPEDIERDARRSRARIAAAPVVLVVCLTMRDMDGYPDARRASAERTLAVQSVAMAAQNILLMAHALGLGACWMCAPLFCPDIVRQALGLADDWEAQALLTVGAPGEAGKRPSREPLGARAVYLE